MKYEKIQSKSILSKLRSGPDPYFGVSYNMNIYRGCQHACIYCDSRSSCYQIEDFDHIQLKVNSLELLEQSLRKKRVKATIGFGSMNDPYMPVEKEVMFTRKALEIINRYKFPVHIITKSTLVLRDIDLLRELSKKYAAVSITVTAADDELSKIIEPGAPKSSERFSAIKQLRDAGVYAGILLMPVLPYITDSNENIQNMVNKAHEAKTSYILGYMGMTIREGQREYFYQKLDKYFPGLKDKYIARFGEQYSCQANNYVSLNELFYSTCKKMGVPTKMKFYEPPQNNQLSLFS